MSGFNFIYFFGKKKKINLTLNLKIIAAVLMIDIKKVSLDLDLFISKNFFAKE